MTPSPPPIPIGLIAGEGVFPHLVARGARAAGRNVICAAFSGSANPELKSDCDKFKWVGVVRIGQWIRFLKKSDCTQAIMVGRVAKRKLFSRWKYLQYIPDLRTLRLWLRELRRDRRDQAILFAVIRELEQAGITLIDSTTFCPDHLAVEGLMTSRAPTDTQWEDIRFGWELCQNLSRMDIGQALAIKNKTVVAVEALEGTNAMIQRAGTLCKAGSWTLIKVSNVRQDMRVDVPTVGVTTIQHLHDAGAGCLVLEAGKTILLEKPKVLELADRLKIAVVGCIRPTVPTDPTQPTDPTDATEPGRIGPVISDQRTRSSPTSPEVHAPSGPVIPDQRTRSTPTTPPD